MLAALVPLPPPFPRTAALAPNRVARNNHDTSDGCPATPPPSAIAASITPCVTSSAAIPESPSSASAAEYTQSTMPPPVPTNTPASRPPGPAKEFPIRPSYNTHRHLSSHSPYYTRSRAHPYAKIRATPVSSFSHSSFPSFGFDSSFEFRHSPASPRISPMPTPTLRKSSHQGRPRH